MPSPSPQPPLAAPVAHHHHHHQSKATPTSPGTASSGGNAARPPLMKRQSSQNSQTSSRHGFASPTASEQHLQHHPARVKPRHHGAKVVLPRNHSSARNLAKMSKPPPSGGHHVAFDDSRRHTRQRSHEGDTEIRLPGSLDEQSRPPMKRNMTAYQLPRTQSQSQVKLKKNLSHGQLTRLGGGHGGSSRNLSGLGAHAARAPMSPGLKGRSKRPKSAEITPAEYRALQERKGSGQERKGSNQERRGSNPERKGSGSKANASKKVGFAVGSDESGDYDDDDDVGVRQLDMEGSGLQEDEWTEESASASPHSTRQNTANNSRRTSMNFTGKERNTTAVTPSDLLAAKVSEGMQRKRAEMETRQDASESEDSSEEEGTSPMTMARMRAPPTPTTADERQTAQTAPRISFHQPAESMTRPQQTPRDEQQQQQQQQQQAAPDAPSTSVHDYADQKPASPAKNSTRDAMHEPRKDPELAKPQAPQHSFAPPIYQQQTARGDAQLETHATAPSLPESREQAHQARKEYANPAAKRVASQQQLPSPAVVSNVSALDSNHSSTTSPAPSLRSSRSNLVGDSMTDAEREDAELVSRFMPSASHPSMGSGVNTALNTPKQGSGFHTPEEHHGIPRDRSGFQVGPTSPGSTVSGSSGYTTPAQGMGRSRTELRLLQEKALADLESRAEGLGGAKPVLPGHVYDRRNESLKSFMSGAELHSGSGLNMGPQIFQGRFRAVNTELRVVQKFRDPVGEAIIRLRGCKGSRLNRPPSASGPNRSSTGLSISKSAVSLPSAQRGGGLSKSASPPKGDGALKRGGQSQVLVGGTGGGSERHQSRRGVSFAGGPPKTREIPSRDEAPNGMSNADIARVAQELWNDF
ncbi:hypothetical protein CKM354_000358500 [Cercospora kikuchii]|uniref:Uncharacterized protein n=1 Tax=Cercospora kikuchii TaxID=84275 RepID=A0A9P3CF47_9PEZI|nr:uncharacterized protein CKM354_000358500 [Cercospora kikuchii]GIZ40237.1 hypothetical protein CKM354_000358500 [Cercospora kikuchii]